MLKHSVVPPTSAITGSIQTCIRHRRKPVAGESRFGQFRTIQITEGHALAAYPDFTGNANRHGLLERIQNMDRGIGNRVADTDRCIGTCDATVCGPDGRFGWTIHIPERACPLNQLLGEVGAQRFSTAQTLECRRSSPACFEQHSPCRGRSL